MKIISNFFAVSLFFWLISIPSSRSQKDGAAYIRKNVCRTHKEADDNRVKAHEAIMPTLEHDKAKGYLGTIGIIGGSVNNIGAVYLASKAALRAGADEVNAFCYKNVAPQLQSLSADIIVHAIVDADFNLLSTQMTRMDVILFGPGAEQDAHMLNNVLPRVIKECKTYKKLLVLDLEPYFLTQNTINELLNYTAPGIIIILNSQEFELFYALTRLSTSSADATIDFDFKNKLGDNCMIFRTGCTDSAVSSNPMSSWSFSDMASPKRSNGQGDIISGLTSVFFNWANKQIAGNLVQMYGPMFPAAVATYKASKETRLASQNAWNDMRISALATDIVEQIGKITS